MAQFDNISQNYDEIITSRAIDTFYVNFFDEHFTEESAVLDLGCGTGVFLSKIKARNKKGVDVSSGMIEEARKRNPGVSFEVSALQDIEIAVSSFDFIVSMYDVINIISDFEEWMKLFHKVSMALRPGGIFVFDINDENRQEFLCSISPMMKEFSGGYSITKVKKVKPNYFNWSTYLFKNKYQNIYELKRMENLEFAPPIESVETRLQTVFSQVSLLSIETLSGKSVKGKSFFVCEK